MERVAFLIEETNERLGCLLNPESLVMRRVAGVQPRRSASGQLTGAGLSDDPLLYTGGGRTELDLDLLFDVSLAGSSITTEDVRELTHPLWDLAENAAQGGRYGHPPLVRFIWGKSWNIPGVVVAVAEHLEHFTQAGVPQRSWLRMRMLRVSESAPADRAPSRHPPMDANAIESLEIPEAGIEAHEVLGGEQAATGSVEAPPSLEGTALGDVWTAADIIARALEEVPAWQRVQTDTQEGETVVQSVRSGADALATPGADPEAVRVETDAILEGLRSIASAAGVDMIATLADATTQINGAVDNLQDWASEAGDGAATQVGPALDAIREVVERVRSSIRPVIAAIKEQAARVIGEATEEMADVTDRIESAMGEIGTRLPEVTAHAQELLGAAVGSVRSMLEEIRTTGQVDEAPGITPTLEKASAALDALWSSGEVAAGGVIRSAVTSLAFAYKNVRAAAESVATVTRAQAAEAIYSAMERIRAALPEGGGTDAGPIPEAVVAMRSGIDQLGLLVDPAELEPVAQAMQTIAAVADSFPEPTEAEEEALQVEAAIATIADVTTRLVSDERRAWGETIQRAMTEARSPSHRETEARPTAPQRARGADVRVSTGERLDQIAYQYYRDPALWRLLAMFNQIDDPLHLHSGRLLRIPPASAWRSL